MAYKNPEDQKAYARQHYLDNKELYIARAKKSSKSQRETNKKWLKEYLLSHPCVDCGETDIEVLQFDHIERVGMKAKRVCNYLQSRRKLEAEIAKCEVRCANCHLRRTRKQLGWFR